MSKMAVCCTAGTQSKHANQLAWSLETSLLPVVQSSRASGVNTQTLPVVRLHAWLTELTVAAVMHV